MTLPPGDCPSEVDLYQICTPLKQDKWQAALHTHPITDLQLGLSSKGMWEGFSCNIYLGLMPIKGPDKPLESAFRHPMQHALSVTTYSIANSECMAIYGPFDPKA